MQQPQIESGAPPGGAFCPARNYRIFMGCQKMGFPARSRFINGGIQPSLPSRIGGKISGLVGSSAPANMAITRTPPVRKIGTAGPLISQALQRDIRGRIYSRGLRDCAGPKLRNQILRPGAEAPCPVRAREHQKLIEPSRKNVTVPGIGAPGKSVVPVRKPLPDAPWNRPVPAVIR